MVISVYNLANYNVNGHSNYCIQKLNNLKKINMKVTQVQNPIYLLTYNS